MQKIFFEEKWRKKECWFEKSIFLCAICAQILSIHKIKTYDSNLLFYGVICYLHTLGTFISFHNNMLFWEMNTQILVFIEHVPDECQNF